MSLLFQFKTLEMFCLTRKTRLFLAFLVIEPVRKVRDVKAIIELIKTIIVVTTGESESDLIIPVVFVLVVFVFIALVFHTIFCHIIHVTIHVTIHITIHITIHHVHVAARTSRDFINLNKSKTKLKILEEDKSVRKVIKKGPMRTITIEIPSLYSRHACEHPLQSNNLLSSWSSRWTSRWPSRWPSRRSSRWFSRWSVSRLSSRILSWRYGW